MDLIKDNEIHVKKQNKIDALKYRMHFGYFKGEQISYEEVEKYHSNYEKVLQELKNIGLVD